MISRSGDSIGRDALINCGGKSLFTESIGNEIYIFLLSTRTGMGAFNCTIKAVAPTAAKCDCGWAPKGRIAGGVNTGVNEFVSHAAFVDNPTREMFCGGIILTQYHILSAAHCFDAFPTVSQTAVVVGDHDISTGTDTIWAAGYLISGFIKHPGYNSETNDNDISIVKTRDYIKFK